MEKLKRYDLNCNIFDVYNYDGLSMQELLCQFYTKINECVEFSNSTLNLCSWLVNEGLKGEVAEKLVKWLSDGTLENIINVNLFENLNKKIDNVSSDLEQAKNINSPSLLYSFKHGNHNAFTSIVYNDKLDKYYCVFRTGKTHNSNDGSISLIESRDGETWSLPRTIVNTTLDDRDPSLFVDDDGTMILNFFTLEDGVGNIYTSMSSDGIEWTLPKISISNQFVTSPIFKENNTYYMATYGVNTINIYSSNNADGVYSRLSNIPLEGDISPSEPTVIKLNNRYTCLIRSDETQDSNIYISDSVDLLNWSTIKKSDLKGKPRGYIVKDDYILIGVRKVNNYVYYGECFIYKLDINTLELLEEFNISNSYDGDVGYFSFASKDNNELLISYYDKQKDSASTLRILKTKFSNFKSHCKVLSNKHSLSSHDYPYTLKTDDMQIATLTLNHEKNGDYLNLVDDRGKVCFTIKGLTNPNTENAQHIKLMSQNNGSIYIQPSGSSGIVYMGVNNEFELNGVGKLISRKGQDLRGGTTSEQLKVLRKNLDTSSGYVDIQRLDVGLSSNRPTGVQVGYCYYDSSLQKPIWWNGSVWKDSQGTTV